MNLQVQLDGSQRVEVVAHLVLRVPADVRLIEDGGLKLAPPLGAYFLDDGSGRFDLNEAAVEAELRRRLIEGDDPEQYLWSFESVEVQR